MMVVAGEEPDDDELLIDDVDEGDDTVFKGPVYPEGRSILLTVGDLRRYLAEVIKKSGGKYTLYTKHRKGGKRRKLGTHGSLVSAKRQERAIHAHGG